MTTVQLDLFGPDTETLRLVDGLRCLRDVVPEAMDVLIHLAPWQRVEHRELSLCGEWIYTLRLDGLRYERRDEWRGKSQMRRITWTELAEQLADDPRRPQILAWARTLPMPNWKELIRPFELWPDSGSWHPSYITGDHERPGWDHRIAAWRALQAICTDAIARLDPEATA